MRDRGVFLSLNDNLFDCWVDADFWGMWDAETAEYDGMTARSWSGHIITYAGCMIVSISKLQNLITLLATEAKILALSLAFREVIRLMKLVREVNLCKIHSDTTTPCVQFKVFKDNYRALEIARAPKICPWMKHINTQVYSFWSYVDIGHIYIHVFPTLEKRADLFTKQTTVDFSWSWDSGIWVGEVMHNLSSSIKGVWFLLARSPSSCWKNQVHM